MTNPFRNSTIGKTLYGSLFVFALPWFLARWSGRAERFVDLPAVYSLIAGVAIAILGGAILIAGIATLMYYGKGLPMNAYPPKELVHRGIYKLIPHPIYLGFSILCAGVAISAGSAAGLWLVTPIVCLSCAALVMGFEKPELLQRFGHDLPKPYIALPENERRKPLRRGICSVYLLVFLPWAILYELVIVLGVPANAASLYLSFEKDIPVIEWTEIFYAGTYVFVMIAPLIATSARELRRFAIQGLAATLFVLVLFLVFPITAPPREFVPTGLWGRLLVWERLNDTPAAAFPSFHVVWALLAAGLYASAFPKLKAAWWGVASVISLSCVTTGMHSLADVAAGAVVVVLVSNINREWEWIRSTSERIANDWREWHFGPVRVINHGIYTGIGTFIGLLIVGSLLGSAYLGCGLLVSFCSLVCAGLWAQFIEGSPRLLRPYGYYGGILGGFIGAGIASLFGGDFWVLMGAFSVAAPWIQAAGRLRCLVQGCCHGGGAPVSVGIRYSHPMSRVCRIAGQKGVPLHPTQTYSILWNIVCGILIARLWWVGASLPLVVGVYLILNGLGRFVEESYRGEPQTPVWGKMRLYQWMSILSVFAGSILTMIGSGSAVPPAEFNWTSLPAATLFGLFTWFAQGVDFPESNKRFARLT